ncbi:MAG: hypothetical protein ACLU6Y_13825 [Ruminococcus sp.]
MESVERHGSRAEQETYYFSPCFYVFPQFKRTVEILKETGYPISMDDVDLSSVEVNIIWMNTTMKFLLPIVYDQPEQLEGTEKGSEMLSDGTILGKRGSWINGPA